MFDNPNNSVLSYRHEPQILRKNHMSEDQQREAKRWFIERFIDGAFALKFALRLHGLEPLPRLKQEFNRQKPRWPRLNFSFTNEPRGLVISANQPESAWAEGLIFLDKSGNFQYITGKIVISRDVLIPDFPSD